MQNQNLNEHNYRLTMLLDQLEEKNALTEAMRSAANMNDVETIKHLLTQEVSVNTVDECGFSAACKKGYKEALNAMIEHADLEGSCNTNNDEGNTLIISTRSKHLNVTKLLLRYGVNIEARDKFGRTALLWACAVCSLDFVELFLEYGSKVDVVDNQGNTCLRF
jgi:ankyrin repeat protein